jgi:hypothetical protein
MTIFQLSPAISAVVSGFPIMSNSTHRAWFQKSHCRVAGTALFLVLSPLFCAEDRRGGRKKVRGLFNPPKGEGVSARSDRRGNAQEKAGHGRFLLVRFPDELVKSP